MRGIRGVVLRRKCASGMGFELSKVQARPNLSLFLSLTQPVDQGVALRYFSSSICVKNCLWKSTLVVDTEECCRNHITQCQETHWEVLKGCLRVGTRQRDRGRKGETQRNRE